MVHTKYLRELLLVGVYVLGFLGIVASGGGGGGGGGSNGSPTLNYVGNMDQATISETNATKLVANTLGLQSFVDSTTSVKEGTSTSVNAKQNVALASFSSRFSRKARRAITSTANFVSRSSEIHARTNVDQTEFCDSGSIRITGFIEDNGTGELTLDYMNCREGNETIDGVVNAKVNAFDFAFLLPTDLVLSLSILTLTTPDFSVSIGGSIHSQININTNSEVLTIPEIVSRDNQTGGMVMVRNQVSTIYYDNVINPSSFSETFDGRIYDSVFGYVDFFTDPLLYYSSSGQIFPYDGQLILTGALNAMIRVIALSDTQVSIDLDLDGNGSFEVDATLNWTEITSPQNLADSDGDGMHDSWEQANGLDPIDPSDASLDTDTDGFDNLSEYLGGSDPNNAGSTPPTADLSITKTASANPVAGTNLTYFLNVTNLGTIPAENVEVLDTLPPEVSFVSFSAPGAWICSETSGTVACTSSSHNAGLTDSISIVVTLPLTAGNISNTATISSTSIDTIQGNNTSTLITNVLPAVADLSITKSASASAVATGDNLSYNITVRNNGPNSAADVVVIDTLPTGFTLVSVTPSQGSCTQTANVTCNFGTMGLFNVSLIDIVVTPTIEGIVDNTATVSSSTQDPDSTNNSSTITTLVGASTSVIQSQIDAAISGDTILVDPGTYIGALDFDGKDITLRSNDGPATTIIHGNNSNAITIGPGGTLEGFTIAGARAAFGAGIEARGSGTLITGNIFDGNSQSGGGFGAAIGGSSSSPVIERNIFRNNSCDNQFLSSVIGFVNSSSPVIVNNIFENNPCRGINMTLPTGNTPLVINNTFIGNRAGIRIDRRVNTMDQTYRNNIIVQNDIGLEVDFGTEADNPVWENNLVFDNSIDYQGILDQSWINGNISSDPIFIDAAAGNYRLQIGSPAIDTGSSVDAPAIDFDGTTRPLDGDGDTIDEVDIGAFEAPAL